MKILSVVLMVVVAVFAWYPTGSADRLHHWIDSKGVAHLSKEPPPEDGKLVEIMEYSVSRDKSAKTDPVDSGRKSQNRNENEIVEKVPDIETQPKPKDVKL